MLNIGQFIWLTLYLLLTGPKFCFIRSLEFRLAKPKIVIDTNFNKTKAMTITVKALKLSYGQFEKEL